MKLIDKDKVIAEIEKIIEEPAPSHDQQCPWEDGYYCGLYKAESIIDTFDTKEVDLEKELDKYTADNFWALEGNNESPYLLEKDDMLKVAKYFYELGLKAKDVDEIIKTAEDYAYFAGSENTREKLIDKACEWLSQTDFCHYYNKEFIDDFRKAMEE